MNAGESEGVFVERRAIEVEQAESASRELLADIQRKIPQVLQAEYRWPFLKLGDSDATTNMARAFGEVKGKELATKALNATPDQVEIDQCNVILYVKVEKTARENMIQPAIPGKVYMIIALNELSVSNGLPRIGASEQDFELLPGDTLVIPGQLPQRFPGKSNEASFGVAILLAWKRKLAKSDQQQIS